MSLIVVGSMAFDAIETPFGKSDKIIGGAATYIAWSASNFTRPVQQISVVGGDFPKEELKMLEARGVMMDGVQIKENEKSFFWSGRYHLDMNTRDTLETQLNVLGSFKPVVPDSYQGCEFLMLGNLLPSVQLSVINQLKNKPKLVVLDTMNFWMDTAMADLEKVLKKVDVLLLYDDQVFFAPALPLEVVFDPTGAGDTFAGGFIGHIARTKDISFENMKSAIIVGSAMASFCVEKFGPERLKEITKPEIDDRIQQFINLVNF